MAKSCCVTKIVFRHFHSGSSNTAAISPQKMQAKNVVLNQWKLLTQLKEYVSRITPDNKTFENAVNKEFAQFLQKIQPSVYGTELVRYFETLTVPSPAKSEESRSGIISIPSVLNGLMKTKEKEPPKKIVPKWKQEVNSVVSKEAVTSRTRQILWSLLSATSHDSKLNKIEELNLHLNKYPEAKHYAVKDGAIQLMLKTRSDCSNVLVKEACNESLSLLGYAPPLKGKGVKILSIDGGGVRGIIVIEMLKKLEELTGKRIYELFDLICGVSTGAIITTSIALNKYTLDDISDIYKNLSTEIFTQSTFKGTSSLVWSQSYYDTNLWESMLKKQLGDQTLISTARNEKCPKVCILSAVVNQPRVSGYIFRNYALPCRVQSQYLGSHNHLIWETVRASAAAPTYFEECKLGPFLHQDGGILFNNPAAVAVHEAKLLWPEAPVQCVMSFGTGRTVPTPPKGSPDSRNLSWKDKFYAIIESATDTEGIHTTLSDLLPANTYYRFNPYLTEIINMDEIDPKKVEQLKRDVIMYLRRNEDKFQDAAQILNVEKNFAQKTLDWFNEQKEIYGFRNVP